MFLNGSLFCSRGAGAQDLLALGSVMHLQDPKVTTQHERRVVTIMWVASRVEPPASLLLTF